MSVLAEYSHKAYAFDSAKDRMFWRDDFEGDQLKDRWTSAGEVGGSAAVVDGVAGAICRITTDGDATDTWRIDWGNIRSLFFAKRPIMEARVAFQTITQVAYVQFELWNTTNDNFGFEYWDGHPFAPNWGVVSEDGGSKTSLDSGISITTSYLILRCEAHTHGSSHIHYFINGIQTSNSPISTNVPDDAGDKFQPYLIIATNENATKYMDVDYVGVAQDR